MNINRHMDSHPLTHLSSSSRIAPISPASARRAASRRAIALYVCM